MRRFAAFLTGISLVTGLSDASAQTLQAKVNLKGSCESRADLGNTAYRLLKVEKNSESNSLSMGVSYLRCVKEGAKYGWKSIAPDAKREEKTPDGRKITLWQTDVELLAVDEQSKVIGQVPLKLDASGRIEVPISRKLTSLDRAELMIRGHQFYQLDGQPPVGDGVSTTASYMLKFSSESGGSAETGVCQPPGPDMDSSGLKALPAGMLPPGVQPGGVKTGAQIPGQNDCSVMFGAVGFKPGAATQGEGGARSKPATRVNKALP